MPDALLGLPLGSGWCLGDVRIFGEVQRVKPDCCIAFEAAFGTRAVSGNLGPHVSPRYCFAESSICKMEVQDIGGGAALCAPPRFCCKWVLMSCCVKSLDSCWRQKPLGFQLSDAAFCTGCGASAPPHGGKRRKACRIQHSRALVVPHSHGAIN